MLKWSANSENRRLSEGCRIGWFRILEGHLKNKKATSWGEGGGARHSLGKPTYLQ